jgi:ribose transport system substrate-binding protein
LAKAKIKRLYLIPILSKALDVIELFEQESASLTLEDVYQKTNISKTSVYRILKTLVHRGYLAQTPNGQYRGGCASALRCRARRCLTRKLWRRA